MEDVVDSGSTLAFPGYFIDKISFNHFCVIIDKQIDDVNDHGTLVLSEVNVVLLENK